MSHTDEMIRKLGSEDVKEQLRYLYGSDEEMLAYQLKRYTALIRRYAELVGEEDRIQLISAPGRTEIGGNHTDHNHGRVLAAAVNLDALCAAGPREDMKVIFHSEGYDPVEIDLSDLSVRQEA